MNKQKARKIFVYVLLGFLIFLYIFTLLVFVFGSFEAGLSLLAYNAFMSVIVYFLLQWQRRMEDTAKKISGEDKDFIDSFSNENTKEKNDSK